MIKKIGHITLLVRDQDEALAFYTDKLGFEKRADDTFGEGMRWLTICPKGQTDLEITLIKADTPEKLGLVGRQAGDHVFLTVETGDCKMDYEALKAKGVEFLSAPTEQMWGTEAVFKDLYGNVYDLVQPRQM